MKRLIIILSFLPLISFGQFNPDMIDAFKHQSIISDNDTIRYSIYSKGNIEEKRNILVFFDGSGPNPLFQKGTIVDTVKVVENGEINNHIRTSQWFGTTIPIDLEAIPSDFIFVAISKKGVPFLDEENSFVPTDLYFNNEGLNYRVWQGDRVISDLIEKWIPNPEKLVILGHSEGSDVVAKLGHSNKKVTHIGFFAGGANTQYYEYALMVQKKVIKGEITQDEGIEEINALFKSIKHIQEDPTNINKQWWGNSFRRWAQFTEPPLDNLLKIEQPLYVAVGAKDESVPFEGSLLIPIEFLRHNKENLTFKMYPDYTHSFSIEPQNDGDDWKHEFMVVFEDFMSWVNQ